MNCPKCDGKTLVTDSRKAEKRVIRYRTCKKCGNKFVTKEVECNRNELQKIWAIQDENRRVRK